MMTFRKGLRDFKLPLSTVWLMSDIAEAKGRQELYTKQAPQMLKALREMAMVESVESSNRIEGVTVANQQLFEQHAERSGALGFCRRAPSAPGTVLIIEKQPLNDDREIGAETAAALEF